MRYLHKTMLGFRPRFKFETPLASAEVVRRIQERLQQDNPHRLWMKNAQYHIALHFPERDAEAWTPQMDINFEELEQGGTLVRCLIGPSPGIWMLFLGGYLGLTLLGLTGITLGLAQRMVNDAAWGFWAVPIALVGSATLFFLAHSGQQRAHDAMRVLKEFVDGALGCDCFQLAEAQAG